MHLDQEPPSIAEDNDGGLIDNQTRLRRTEPVDHRWEGSVVAFEVYKVNAQVRR